MQEWGLGSSARVEQVLETENRGGAKRNNQGRTWIVVTGTCACAFSLRTRAHIYGCSLVMRQAASSHAHASCSASAWPSAHNATPDATLTSRAMALSSARRASHFSAGEASWTRPHRSVPHQFLVYDRPALPVRARDGRWHTIC